MCNCCPCCCHMLMLLTKHGYEEAVARSAYIARVEAGLCAGCAVCAEERCPVGAVDMADGCAVVNSSRCIGCGLCVTTCPSGAMRLAARKEYSAPPANTRELVQQIIASKARSDKK